jgi:hypothetical protein
MTAFKNVAKWFTGTHEQLMELLGKSKSESTADKILSSGDLADTTKDLSVHTVTELKTMAKERGFKGYSSLKKAQLIELLNK